MLRATIEHPQPVDVESLGASFCEVGVDVIKGETMDFFSRWFRSSSSDADLLIWIDGENRIVKTQLNFYGQVVEWNAIHGTRTGVIVEEELCESTSESTSQPALTSAPRNEPVVSETVLFDGEAQASVVQQAMRLLAHVPKLTMLEKHQMIYQFRESPKLRRRSRERALKEWAHVGSEIVNEARPSFWKKLSRWFFG